MIFKPELLTFPDYTKEEIQRCRDAVRPGSWETGLIVDANNVMYRLAFAASDDISNPTEMLAMFNERIESVAKDVEADVVVCCIDWGVSLRRSMLGATKKSQKTPEQEVVINIAREALHTLREKKDKMNPVALDGYEADDLAAAFAVSGMFVHTVIYSTDSDLFQVTNGNGVAQMSPATGAFLSSKIPPEMVPAVKALAADSSDNVEGVKGIGPVTAMKVLEGLSKCDLSDADTRRVVNNLALVALPFPGAFQCLADECVAWFAKTEYYQDDEVYLDENGLESELPF